MTGYSKVLQFLSARDFNKHERTYLTPLQFLHANGQANFIQHHSFLSLIVDGKTHKFNWHFVSPGRVGEHPPSLFGHRQDQLHTYIEPEEYIPWLELLMSYTVKHFSLPITTTEWDSGQGATHVSPPWKYKINHDLLEGQVTIAITLKTLSGNGFKFKPTTHCWKIEVS